MRLTILMIAFIAFSGTIWGQSDRGHFTGGLESNVNFFMRDSLIGAADIPQYDKQLTGAEAWINLDYTRGDLRMGMRFDVFNNSNLLNPTSSYTDQGIGRWYIAKSINKLDLEAGYIYDQIGSGIIYRAYEQRPLLIDNALLGLKAAYHLNDNWKLKAFGGKQKFLFGTNDGILKGAALDGYLSLGEESPVTLSPGIGLVNRTLGDESMNIVLQNLRTYLPQDQFTPTYNVYLASVYNTMTYKNLSWYVEAAYKSPDAFYDPRAKKLEVDGSNSFGKYRRASGSVLYTSVSAALGKLGITVEAKRTENFNFRTNPNLRLNRGLVNFIPPMNRVNTFRLTARYAPATQDLSELAFQTDIRYRFNKKLSTLVNVSFINTLDGTALYRELFTEIIYKRSRSLIFTGGVQLQSYNQEIYETKPDVPMISTITPYIDVLYKLSRKKSIRFESQYMKTEQDFGNWVFGLVEFGAAPHWIIESSVMYNLVPGVNSPVGSDGKKVKLAYPTFGVVYSHKSNRFSLRYVKQVRGVVCSGGVCRLEPAFSGVKFGMSSTF